MSNGTPPLFIVGAGRCGATVLSRLLAQHPDVASLSELYNSLGAGAFPRDAVDGPALWEALSEPRPQHQLWLRLLSHGVAIDAFRYPHTGLGRFREGGIPPLLTMTLPELSDDPDGLHEELRLFVEVLPTDRIGAQYRRVFQWLTERVGRRLWVESSSSSIASVPALIRHFPDARFVHVYRDGREAALSASRFPPLRLTAISQMFESRVGRTLFEPVPPADVPRLPPEMRPLVAPGFDVDAFRRVEIPLKYFGSVWSTQMVHGAAMLAGLRPERILHLRYESILADPEPALRRLLAFLDPSLPQEAWLERALPLARANPPKWPILPPDEHAALEASCARGMAVIETLEHRPRAAPPGREGESYQGGHDPESIRAELARILVRVLGLNIAPEQIRPTDALFAHGMGLDSEQVSAIVREVERRFGVTLFEERINMSAFADVLSLGQLVAVALARGSRAAGAGESPQGRAEDLDARRQPPPHPRGSTKDLWLTIVIPVRNEASNLWFTLQGLGFQDLDGVEIVVANNGGEQLADVEKVTKRFGAPARHILADAVASVNFPRSAGAAAAEGEWLLFLDAHVLLSPGALTCLRDRVREGLYPPLSLVHIPLLHESRTGAMGHYRLTLEEDFWGKWGPPVRETDFPYRIAATGNYAMLTRRQDFEAARGFNPRFAGYGGDEIYIQLKYWRLGGEVLLEPLVRGAHYSGPRGYRNNGDEIVRNIGLAGRVVVGPDFLQRFEAKISPHWARYTGPKGFSAALREGVRAAEESGEAAWLEEMAKLSFDEVLDLWRREGVPVA
ncbi:sulfotransferase [Sorangium sp. So ce185]|uniref:sulfotransferase n=1 Tax=Sorangium sp. So ce185 TaxID=3133287 RepID=UPI003F61B4CA